MLTYNKKKIIVILIYFSFFISIPIIKNETRLIEKRIQIYESEIFDLEKNVDLLNQKVIQLTETLSFHHTEPKISKKTALDIDNLLNIEEACDILNLSKSKLMEWVQSDLIKAELIGNIPYFNKEELKQVYRKIMISED